jgi:hypothetical protein
VVVLAQWPVVVLALLPVELQLLHQELLRQQEEPRQLLVALHLHLDLPQHQDLHLHQDLPRQLLLALLLHQELLLLLLPALHLLPDPALKLINTLV